MQLADLWDFFKNPIYRKDEKSDFKNRLLIVLNLLLLSLAINVTLSMITGGLVSYSGLELGEHAIDKMFNTYSKSFILFVAVVLAPVTEEVIFRGPMPFFKKSRYFNFIFYFLTFAFGCYHIVNFKISLTVLLLSPLLIAPQLTVGALLGYLRVRFGLPWAITLHALYNLVLVGIVIMLKNLDIAPE
jgi:membrane protease YdiL (CAAX protease family)